MKTQHCQMCKRPHNILIMFPHKKAMLCVPCLDRQDLRECNFCRKVLPEGELKLDKTRNWSYYCSHCL